MLYANKEDTDKLGSEGVIMVNFEHTQIVQISQRMPHSAECYLNYSIQTGNSVPVAAKN